MAVAPVVVVQQDSRRDFNALQFSYLSDFFAFNFDIFNRPLKAAVLVVKADFNSLLTEYLISVLARSLADFKARELALICLEFCKDLVESFCLKPVLAPLEQI